MQLILMHIVGSCEFVTLPLGIQRLLLLTLRQTLASKGQAMALVSDCDYALQYKYDYS